jgi:hypothetical protein
MSSFWKFFNPSEEGEGQAGKAEAKDKIPPPPDTVKKPSKPPRAGSTPPPPPDISLTPTGPKLPGVLIEPSPARRSQPPSAETNMRYGIDDAIKLMRTLPVEENENLVVRVMKTTLESLKVRIGDIVDDAMKRQDVLGKKVADYKAQIVSFEREIEARRHEIQRLEDELGEVTRVKERLLAADQLSVTPNPPLGGSASVAGHGHPAFRTGGSPPIPPPRKPELPKRPGSIPPKNELPPVIVAPQSEPELIPASESVPSAADKDKKDDKKKDVYKDDD